MKTKLNFLRNAFALEAMKRIAAKVKNKKLYNRKKEKMGSDYTRAAKAGVSRREYRNTMRLFRQVFSSQEYLFCTYCKCKLDDKTLTLEHIIPLSNGGNHSLENIEPCCFECNMESLKKDFNPIVRMYPNLDKNGNKVNYEM